MIEIPPPPAEEPTDDEVGTSSPEESTSEMSGQETEPSEMPTSGDRFPLDIKTSKSLPDDELTSNRKSQSPIQGRRRSKSDTRVGGMTNDDGQEGQLLGPDDPLVQAVQREISEAFNMSNDDLNYFAEELLTELAIHDEEDGNLGERMTSSTLTPSSWQETFQNLPENYTVTDV